MSLTNDVTELIQGADTSKWTVRSNHNIKCFTKGEIERITNNYKTVLGRGGFGEVYEGVLEDKSKVAVKRFIHNVKENFAKELTVHREINHRNVLRLIGYCVEENAVTMVTEYIPNGNLSDILHSDNTPISLDVRLRIATECAEALAYMHSHMRPRVIHGDIKPSNILLDGSFHAVISDFGISRLLNTERTQKTSNVMGCKSYMDPLFIQDGRLTVKSDIYSFGHVLLELITRKKPVIEFGNGNVTDLFPALAGWMKGIRERFDSEIASKNNKKILEEVAMLAGECMKLERNERPEMIEVAERLRTLRKALKQGKQRVDLFSWVRKKMPSPPTVVTVPTKPTKTSDLCRQFSFAEMKVATRDFDNSLLVSDHTFVRVYRGNLRIDEGASEVAVKRFNSRIMPGPQKFRAEKELMLKLNHPNLVPLMGYCDETDHMVLVYYHMDRGSLHEHLYGTQKPPLIWKQRLEICIGVARGLHYLHEGAERAIIHGNLNPANIFLDENFVAKIIDVGTATPVDDTKILQGSNSLDDCEYSATPQPKKKSDIYSFGAVLFEVLFAQPFVDYNRPRQQVYLSNWALRYKKEGNLDQVIDRYLKGKIDPQSLKKFSEIAESCVAEHGTDHPSMGDVLSELECALQLHERAVSQS